VWGIAKLFRSPQRLGNRTEISAEYGISRALRYCAGVQHPDGTPRVCEGPPVAEAQYEDRQP
jgi:hypothetical protein